MYGSSLLALVASDGAVQVPRGGSAAYTDQQAPKADNLYRRVVTYNLGVAKT